jgi:hypothetical protein
MYNIIIIDGLNVYLIPGRGREFNVFHFFVVIIIIDDIKI